MGWEFVERWRTPQWQVSLSRIEEWNAKAWRVEWGQVGHAQRPGQSFTGDNREQSAREFLASKMAELGGDWQHQ